jgi:hypothetical protein
MAGMNDRKTKPLGHAERGGAPYPGDIVAIRGKGLISRLVLAAEGAGADDKGVSHVALVIADKPPLVIEAVHPRVRVCTLENALAEAENAWLLHPKPLTDEERETVVKAACDFCFRSYGYPMLILHALNAAFGTTPFTNPIRSRMMDLAMTSDLATASQAPGAAIPERGAAWWIRVVILLLSPLLMSLYIAGATRLTLRGVLGSSLFALLEGLSLLLLGIIFIRSWPGLSSKSLAFALSYIWGTWIVFLELSATEPQ